MTRYALSIEAVGRRANNVLLPHSIQAWDNDCWSNKVIEKQLDRRHIPPSKLEQYCMGCWPGLITWAVGLASALEQSSKTDVSVKLYFDVIQPVDCCNVCRIIVYLPLSVSQRVLLCIRPSRCPGLLRSE